MNPDLERLQAYPFERLTRLQEGVRPPGGLAPIALSIGEPKHATPKFIGDALAAHLEGLSTYPTTRGLRTLREAIASWLTRRFSLEPATLDPDRHVLPVNGTREALFAFAQCVVDHRPSDAHRRALVLMPNPFYQIYEGAALLAGAEPGYLHCLRETAFTPDFEGVPDDVWRRRQLLYLCSPGNPTGTVLDAQRLEHVLELADEFDFVVAADECYAEVHLDEGHAPVGLLEAAERIRDFVRGL